ncbi:unnamed protein product [Ranitomeya imitator]|uniref:Uncharacterized protein n=1 Tax=Ranitomeya imitator TaxID=111125 RepID=A0ABN9L469_9NEOB|nr:unnamed protein product [Ranitomeya imitator]
MSGSDDSGNEHRDEMDQQDSGSTAGGDTAPAQPQKFNLDKGKKDDSKKEEEEKRRWRLIPQTFVNWQQAFAILASVIGEKFPENCSGLFCYLDAIGEAHRTYGGQAWLRYDEQFRQRKAVRPEIRWDQKDIGLWLKVMAPAAAPAVRLSAGQCSQGCECSDGCDTCSCLQVIGATQGSTEDPVDICSMASVIRAQ